MHFKKQEDWGKEEDNFLNAKSKPVHWKFIDVSELHKLDELIDGAEMYSKICEEEDADIYIRNHPFECCSYIGEQRLYETIHLN